MVSEFEAALAQATGAKHAVAVNSGTSALHLALKLLGVKSGDEVIMPCVSFVAPANAIDYCGASPVFVDIDVSTWQMSCDQVEEFLRDGCDDSMVNRATGKRVKAILVVHLFGGMANIDRLAELAAKYNLALVEDAAECLGAKYRGRPMGAPLAAIDPERRIVITSFNGNKIITTGGGGALMTDSDSLSYRARHLATTAKCDPVEFFHDEVGYNYRMTSLSAALGLAQLERLEEFVEKKRAIARKYIESFAGLDAFCPIPEAEWCTSSYWMFTAMFGEGARGKIGKIAERGVSVRPVWVPLPDLPAFKNSAIVGRDYSDKLYEAALSLPCSTGLTCSEQQSVISAVCGVFD